jgi:hypothetical protein
LRDPDNLPPTNAQVKNRWTQRKECLTEIGDFILVPSCGKRPHQDMHMSIRICIVVYSFFLVTQILIVLINSSINPVQNNSNFDTSKGKM